MITHSDKDLDQLRRDHQTKLTKIYRGTCDGNVTVNGQPLNPRHDLRNHAPGFGWGATGREPQQLAIAIMADHLNNDDLAMEIYEAFKFYVIAGIKKPNWQLTTSDLDRFVKSLREGKLP